MPNLETREARKLDTIFRKWDATKARKIDPKQLDCLFVYGSNIFFASFKERKRNSSNLHNPTRKCVVFLCNALRKLDVSSVHVGAVC
jgi:hypothetical protein